MFVNEIVLTFKIYRMMKTSTTFFTILLSVLLIGAYQVNADSWTQKTNFGGFGRELGASFSIGSKAYIGTGFNGSAKYKDFWEYDPSTNTWTQKADFGGTGRAGAVGFSIGSKGYLGTGADAIKENDFWEYNPSTNVWTQKTNFGGAGRANAVGFSIGNKGYIGTGVGNAYYNDFWEYDPINDTWTQKANFGGVTRAYATGFGIGTKGYIGTGYNGTYFSDFWEFDPIANSWTQKTDFPTIREGASGFSVATKGFIATGFDGTSFTNDLWEYNQSDNTWTQKANFGGSTRFYATALNVGLKGYFGTGNDCTYQTDFWEYAPDSVGSTTGIDELKNTVQVSLFPNPVSNLITVTSNQIGLTEIIIYNNDSREKIHQKFNGSVSLDIENFAAGVYIYEVRNENGIIKKGELVKQ